jgi:K+/H+ antiporter YhaU regulatory subunit KhtT
MIVKKVKRKDGVVQRYRMKKSTAAKKPIVFSKDQRVDLYAFAEKKHGRRPIRRGKK